MSILATVYLKETIVMAADSRVTGDGLMPDKTKEKLTLSDNGQKLFLLADRIGISTCGIRTVNGKPISEFLSSFEEEIVDADNVRNVADKLCQVGIDQKIGNTKFHVCGFDGKQRGVYLVEDGKVVVQADKDTIESNVVCSGETELVAKLYTGTNPISVNWQFMEQKDAIDFATYIVEATCLAHRFQLQLGTCGGPVDILLLTAAGPRWIRHKVFDM